jgi:hypothetical protein
VARAQDEHQVPGEYRTRVGPMTLAQFAFGIGYVVLGALNLADDHRAMALLWWAVAAVWLAQAVVGRQTRTLVDADGVRVRTVRGWKQLRWDEVDFTTSEPSKRFPPADLTLRAKDGREVVTQIPALGWSEVKEYGQRHSSADRPPAPA